MNGSDAFVFIHFLAARVLDIVAEDGLVTLRVLRTCTRRKAAIKQAPERWKRACIKSNLLVNNSSATAATTTTTLSGVAGSDAGVAHRGNAGRMAAAEGRRSMGVDVSQSKLFRAIVHSGCVCNKDGGVAACLNVPSIPI